MDLGSQDHNAPNGSRTGCQQVQTLSVKSASSKEGNSPAIAGQDSKSNLHLCDDRLNDAVQDHYVNSNLTGLEDHHKILSVDTNKLMCTTAETYENNSKKSTAGARGLQNIGVKEKQNIQEFGNDTFKCDFLRASSTLKIKSATNLLAPSHESSQDLFHGFLDINTVASLLPRDRTSTEESAIEHILTLETDQARHRHHSLQAEDINGFTSEQDSGIFDLSLVQQEDFDNYDVREATREWPIRNLTPEQRRKCPQLSKAPESVWSSDPNETGRKTEEDYQKVKRNLRIPSCFFNNFASLPDSEVHLSAQDSELMVKHSPKETKQKAAKEKQNCGNKEVSDFSSSSGNVAANSAFSQVFEWQVLCSETSSELGPEKNQDLLDDNCQDTNMGKKTQSLSRGKQPHVVYSKDEFSEEYASPQRSRSWDKKKHGKKGSEKKDKNKPKDRKRILSDPSQGMNLKVMISAPLTASQEESVKSKGQTIDAPPPRTPTQEAGTDTHEFLADSDILTVQQETSQFAAPLNESNNNHEQHKLRERLADSRTGGKSPECNPTFREHPMSQSPNLKSSPQVITDTLNKASASHEQAVCDGPPLPPKPKRLSLTNQLQKHNGKSVDVSVHQEGSPSLYPKTEHVYERKTEIAVERQVLLKQAAKIQPTNHSSSQNTQADQTDAPSPFTVVTRFIDGEEELILGALPLQENESKVSTQSQTPVSSSAKTPEKLPTTTRKFRHYACIEPVGKPVQMIETETKTEDSAPKLTSSPQPKEDQLKANAEDHSLDLCISPGPASDQDNPASQKTPPVVVTSPSTDITLKIPEAIPDSRDGATSPEHSQSSTVANENASLSPEKSPQSLERNQSRLHSFSDTASTISIPPQSPPDLDYQELLALTEDSQHSPEFSGNVNFTEADPATEQKMVTVALAMIPQLQKAEVTIISDGGEEINSTKEVEKQEVGELQQPPTPDDKEESAKGSVAAPPQAVTSRVDIPSISSKDEDEADNEEDEDSGVYDASYRHSDWIYVGNNQELQMMTKQVDLQAGASAKAMQTVAEVNKAPGADEPPQFDRADEGRESVTTSASEDEFRTQYQSLAYRRVHRKTSAIDYQRLSLIARERKVKIQKINNMFGFRIQYSRPVVVTDVDKGGAAEQSGLRVGDMILSVSGQDVRQSPHSQVVRLAMTGPDPLDLVVGTNVCNTLNLYAEKPVMCGYLHKLGGAGMIRTWKKRWFVLKYDNCLYYYKTEDDVEPLGAIVLCNYTVMKARDVGKPFAFKLSKCKARTYYFYTATEEEMSRWAKHITEAAKPQNTSDIWLDISTHNVGLPALSIKNPDCHGFLNKLGAIRKTWKRRFCVLKDACLYYYKDIDAQHALGVAHFHGYSIQETEIGSKKFGLILKPPGDELRVFYFFADHETDRKRWVAAFALSIGRWIQTNNGDESDEESAEMLI